MAMRTPEKTTHTKFAFLDSKQRDLFREKWDKVRNMYEKWYWTGNTGLHLGKKDLEQEVIDLEDLSLAAYRALKLLRQQLADVNEDDDYETEHYSA